MKPASLKSSDFQQALGTRPVSTTAHFALHALWRRPGSVQLSTTPSLGTPPAVDDMVGRLGLVVPKKQARRSVTRSLIRHQARESVRRHAVAALSRLRPVGQGDAQGQSAEPVPLSAWVVRLTRGFDRAEFPSAASEALSAAVRRELDELWARVREVRR